MLESDRVHIEATLDDRVTYILQVHGNLLGNRWNAQKLPESFSFWPWSVFFSELLLHFFSSQDYSYIFFFSGLLLHLRRPWSIEGNSTKTWQTRRQKSGNQKYFALFGIFVFLFLIWEEYVIDFEMWMDPFISTGWFVEKASRRRTIRTAGDDKLFKCHGIGWIFNSNKMFDAIKKS